MYTTGALRAGGTGDVGAVGGGGDDEGSMTSGPRSDSDRLQARRYGKSSNTVVIGKHVSADFLGAIISCLYRKW